MWNNIGITITVVSAIAAGASAIITFVQRRRDWHVNAITIPRLQWGENLRIRLADLITAFCEGDKERLNAKIDCVLLYLTPSNKWHKGLVQQLNDMRSGKNVDLSTLIAAAQAVLRCNWWAVKTESFVSYKADQRRDAKLVKRGKAHAAAVIAQVSEVKKCCVVFVKDKKQLIGQSAVAYVVISDEQNQDEVKEKISAMCKNSLPEKCWPDKIRFVPEFPYTAAGKIDFKALKKRAKKEVLGE